MKILYFHQHFSTPKGATGTRSYEMAKRLIERGHEVTMVCGSFGMSKTGLEGSPVKGIRKGSVDGINLIEICLPYSNYDSLLKRAMIFVKFALKSISIAWREKYDLLFATSTPLTASIPGIAMRLLKPKKTFVFEVRDLWPELPKAMGMTNPLIIGGMSILEKISYLTMSGGVALSPGILEGMKKRSSAKKSIELVPNGCDLDLFQPFNNKLKTSKLPKGFPTDGIRCVFTGAHGVANGLDKVLDVGKVLQERGRENIYLIFIGDGKLKPELIKRKERENLKNCFFFDPCPKEELSEVMYKTDIGLMILANIPAFYYGTSPNKFFDYIASGLPVVNNYPGWLSDLINQNNCGIALLPDDVNLFADALIDLADNPKKRQKMGVNSRNLAESSFNRQQLADKLVDFLEKI